jgi:hypothetical protein
VTLWFIDLTQLFIDLTQFDMFSGHLEDHTENLSTSFPIEFYEIKGLRGIFLFKIIPSIHNGEC